MLGFFACERNRSNPLRKILARQALLRGTNGIFPKTDYLFRPSPVLHDAASFAEAVGIAQTLEFYGKHLPPSGHEWATSGPRVGHEWRTDRLIKDLGRISSQIMDLGRISSEIMDLGSTKLPTHRG